MKMINNTIHPIENRYRTKKMAQLYTQSAKLYRWLRVESALAKAHASLGRIPEKDAEEINRKANLEYVEIDRVKEIEDEIHHDLMAMVRALSEQCEGSAGKYIHLGATSYDIEDTATAIQMVNSLDVLSKSIHLVLKNLIQQAEKNKNLICVGRTHGQHAIPTTYGMKFANWADEISCHTRSADNYHAQNYPRFAQTI